MNGNQEQNKIVIQIKKKSKKISTKIETEANELSGRLNKNNNYMNIRIVIKVNKINQYMEAE